MPQIAKQMEFADFLINEKKLKPHDNSHQQNLGFGFYLPCPLLVFWWRSKAEL